MPTEISLEQSPILIVDDEPQNVALLKRILSRAGYSRLSATTDPTEVVALYQDIQPELILLDLNMPTMDGFEVMKVLQARFPDKNLNIIVVTALDGQSVRRNVLDAGARDFINKPIDRSELLTRIHNHLQTHALYKRLESQNAELAKANNTLAELNQSMADLMSIVSHELRTPLTAIKSFAEILRDEDDKLPAEDRRHFLDIIDNESDRLNRLITDLLDLQKIESGKMHWGTDPVDLVEVVHNAVAFFKPTYDSKQLDIELDCTISEARVITDIDKLQQVIYNLLSNAFKFTERGGIKIKLSCIKNWARVLLLSNDPDVTHTVQQAADSLQTHVSTITTSDDAIAQLNRAGGQIDLLIVDSKSRSAASTDTMNQIWQQFPNLPVITINEDRHATDDTSTTASMAMHITDLIGLSPSHPMYELSISDTGQGIPEEQLSRVFERFHQVDSSQTREQRGTGLGLTICQQIVQHYRGKMWVESVCGEGSTFHLLLPTEHENKKKLGKILIEKGLVTEQQLSDALRDQ